jgi:bacillithiol system protein YtxJ
MKWIPLTDPAQLDEITAKSADRPQLIFKHSTRCSISSMALGRLQRSTPPEGIDFYLLDLIRYRNISNVVAERFKVHHESPQVILLKDGNCIYEESHGGIEMEEIAAQAN